MSSRISSGNRLNQVVTLADGRRLGFDELGRQEGTPVLYFHGFPSSRLEWALFGLQELVGRLNLRLIAVDRPGVGLSSFQPRRRVTNWPSDVAALADRLEISHFAVLGYSGGSAYAAACAWQLSERMTRAGIVCGEASHDDPQLTQGMASTARQFDDLALRRPLLCRGILVVMGLLARFAPNRLLAQAIASLPEPDRAFMASAPARRAFVALLREALRQGPRGPQVDTALAVGSWGIPLKDIRVPVYIWHGEADVNAPPAMARSLAASIPNSRAVFYPNEGHISAMARHVEEIFRAVGAS